MSISFAIALLLGLWLASTPAVDAAPPAQPHHETGTATDATSHYSSSRSDLITTIPYRFFLSPADGRRHFHYCDEKTDTNIVFSYKDGAFIQHKPRKPIMHEYIQPDRNVASLDQVTVRFSIHAVSREAYKEAKCKLHPRSTIKVYTADQYVTIKSSDGAICLTSEWFHPCELLHDNTLSAESRAQWKVNSILRLVRSDRMWNYFEMYDCKNHGAKFDVAAFRQEHKEELLTQIEHAKGKEPPTCAICLDTIQPGNIVKIRHAGGAAAMGKNCGLNYCLDCMQKWYASKTTCPLCHISSSPNDVIPS